MSKISQREAHRLRKEVQRLKALEEQRNNSFAKEYSGIWICQEDPEPVNLAGVRIARKLGYAVVVRTHNDKFQFYAVPLEATKPQ